MSIYASDNATGDSFTANPDSGSITETLDGDWSIVEAMKAFWTTRLVDMMYVWFPPILIIGGTIGNFLVIAVSRTSHFKHSPATLLMVLLACSDLFILHSQLTRFWLTSVVSDTNINPTTDIGCQLLSFATYVGFDTSSMTVVMISMERAVTVTQPLKAKTWLTKKRIGRIWLAFVVAFLGLNAHLFWTMQYDPTADQLSVGESYAVAVECHLRKDTELMMTIGQVWYYVDFCLFAGVPIVLIVGANTIIAVSVKSSRNIRKQMHGGSQLQDGDVTKKKNKKKGMSQLTSMLLLMSSMFCVCTFPVIVYPFIADIIFPNAGSDLEVFCMAYLLNAIFGMLLFLNYAINFALYCLGGTKFRLALKELICSCKDKTPQQREVSSSLQ